MWNNEKLIKVLKDGGVAVMPTDTLYGIVGSATKPETVERIYKLRKRSPQKPCIILICGTEELEKFSIKPTEDEKNILCSCWPGPVSIVVDCVDEKFSYLTRGTGTLAFRVPQEEELRKLLSDTGPLIAPSANMEGLTPSRTIEEAKKYFAGGVDEYIDGGEISKPASKIIRLHKDGRTELLRA